MRADGSFCLECCRCRSTTEGTLSLSSKLKGSISERHLPPPPALQNKEALAGALTSREIQSCAWAQGQYGLFSPGLDWKRPLCNQGSARLENDACLTGHLAA